MIEKWFCIRCDNCNEVINYLREDNVYNVIERVKKEYQNTPIIASCNGLWFCDEKCQKEWLAKRRQVRKI